MKHSTPRSRWPALTAGLLAGLFLADITLFALMPLTFLYPSLPAHDREPVAAAAVLFNGFTPDGTAINDETRRRLHYGLSLLRGNQTRLLLVAGGSRPDKGINGARLIAGYLRGQGVAEELILVEDQSRDSLSNLARIREIAEEQGLESVGLVSSPHHLLRIRALNSPAAEGFRFFPYDAAGSDPPLTRLEIWCSAHLNLVAWLAAALLPAPVYDRIVLWVRTHTDL
ncbi:MAG: YdcF family protein [Desulfobulbaceae bacterium]